MKCNRFRHGEASGEAKMGKSIRKFDREYAELTAKQVKAYYLQKAQLQKDVQLTLTFSIKGNYQSEHTIDLCDSCLQITGHGVHNGKDLEYEVQIVKQPWQFQGERWWLMCPSCDKKSSSLYITREGPVFLCWKCQKLKYLSPVNNHDQYWKIDRRMRQIFLELGTEEWTPQDPIPRRPKGMHQKRYKALCDEYRLLDMERDRIFLEGAKKLLERMGKLEDLLKH